MTDDAYPVLDLTPKGVALLKDDAASPGLSLARQKVPRKDAPRLRSKVEAESWDDVDRALFDRLRAVRLDVARERGVPPYVIFHDATLREMARLQPPSLSALLEVKGVGARKADDLGSLFLAAIKAHASDDARTPVEPRLTAAMPILTLDKAEGRVRPPAPLRRCQPADRAEGARLLDRA